MKIEDITHAKHQNYHVQQSCPKYMTTYVYQKKVLIPDSRIDKVWSKLNLRQTFVKSQIFPYKVEFVADSQQGPFESGELNIHHGPLLSVHGAIGEVGAHYRDLQYFYGSYVLSFRLIRPTRLEFIRENSFITIKITYYVKPWFKPVWRLFNKVFWGFFCFELKTYF